MWSFGVIAGSVDGIMRVFSGRTRIGRGVSPAGDPFWMSIVVIMKDRPSGGRGGGSCSCRRGSRWWHYGPVIWYFGPLCALLRS